MMKTFRDITKYITLVLFLGFLSPILAQQASEKSDKDLEKLINKGLRAYDKADYEDAELSFRKALAKDPLNAVASYNLGLTETELDKNLEAAHFFKKAAKTTDDASLKSKAYFNQGNVWYQKKKYEKAIEAYKDCLRQNPDDEEARYNLALAQMKLKKQQKKNKNKKNNKKNNKQNKQQQNKQNQKQNQKNKDKQNQKNKDQNNKDQQKNKGDQKNKEQNKKDQKNKDNKGKGDQKKDDKGKPKDDKQNKQGQPKDKQKQQNGKNGQEKQQPKQGEGQKRKVKLTPQQVKQLLVALKNKEQKTQKKIKAKILKGRGRKQKQDKDW